MTMLTGDFDFDSAVEGLDPLPCLPAPSAAVPALDDAAAMPDDAVLYLRHVDKGEPIRALARELGCHASTILRRIRKFEARRDDPLIDRALDRSDADTPVTDGAQVLRALRRLAEPGAMLAVAESMDKAIVTRDGIRTAIVERTIAESMALNGWVAQIGRGRIMTYAIVPAGREELRRRITDSARGGRGLPRPDEFDAAQPVETPDLGPAEAEQHRVWETRTIRDPEDDRRRRTRINIAESPLLLLARRREADGSPFLTPGQVAAGERLREDFELAQMGPRVTQNWDGFMTAGIDVSRSGAGFRGGSDKARERVATALRDLGPGMGDIVLRVCCFLEGIELTERRLGWSARSGKIVLRLALMRLERHYLETYGKGSPLIG